MKRIIFAFSIMAIGSVFAEGDLLYRSGGFKIGERMTLRPYVNLSYTFDVNTDEQRGGDRYTSYLSINPGFSFDYLAENWSIKGSVYYQYHQSLSGRQRSLNNHSYGESLGWAWSSGGEDGSSWSAMISENFSVINQDDDYSRSGGMGLWRDRKQLNITAGLNRRFNEYWHAGVHGGFYWMDYSNDDDKYGPLFSWDRWSAGANIGFTASKWTDIFITGNYQGYGHDNSSHRTQQSRHVDKNSWGVTLHLGLGSHLTERISYRLSGGFSTFEYGDAEKSTTFTYNGDLTWKFAETWSTTLLLASYYQPSEREAATAIRCDSVSWGLSKILIQGKMRASLDLQYRRETNMMSYDEVGEWDLNIITARLGLSYQLNRFLSAFARGDFQTELNSGNEINRHYDYDRYRVTVGLSLSY